jgi:hypothetical protein
MYFFMLRWDRYEFHKMRVGTRYAELMCLHPVGFERQSAYDKDLHIIFIDLEKAYDKVPMNVMWWAL